MRPSAVTKNVAGLEVAVHDAFAVRGGHAIGDLEGVLHHLVHRGGSFRRPAFDILHHQLVWADVVQRADVGMVERGDGAGFAFEAFGELLLGAFDGDRCGRDAYRGRDTPRPCLRRRGVTISYGSSLSPIERSIRGVQLRLTHRTW